MSVGALLTRGESAGRIYQRIRGDRAAYTGLPEPPASGKTYQTCGVAPYTGSGFSLETGAVPPVAIGDVFIADAFSTPSGYAIQVNNDGTIELFSGGDTSRQSFQYQLYRVASNAIDGPATIYVNEVAPIWATPILLANAPLNVPITPINLASPTYATSPSGDTLTFAVVSGGLPSGLTLTSAGVISGTPNLAGASNFIISATDITGTSTNSPASQISVAAPVVVGLNDGGVRHHSGRRRGKKPPDWQSISHQEAEKIKRLDRKRREKWRAEQQPLEALHTLIEEIAPQLPGPMGRELFKDWDLLNVLSKSVDPHDEHEIHALMAQERQAFMALAQYALEMLQ